MYNVYVLRKERHCCSSQVTFRRLAFISFASKRSKIVNFCLKKFLSKQIFSVLVKLSEKLIRIICELFCEWKRSNSTCDNFKVKPITARSHWLLLLNGADSLIDDLRDLIDRKINCRPQVLVVTILECFNLKRVNM